MQFLPAFSTLFLALTAAVSASPTPVISARQACTTVYPFIQVPVDSSAPDRVYGASSANTIWKNASGNRNMLIAFELPVEATPETPCRLRFHAVANPPMSISSSPVSVNAYMLTSTVESNTSWNGRPSREGFAGSAGLAVSPIDPADMAIVLQGCRSGAMNYELEMPETGHLNFNSDANNGFYMTYGSGCL